MELLNKLHITYENPIEQRIPAKELEKQAEASLAERKLLESSIAKCYLIGILNQQTTRIRSYKDENVNYESIFALKVELKTTNGLADANHLIQSIFPNTLIIHYVFKDKHYISAALKRLNKNDTSKTVIQEEILSEIKYTPLLEPMLIDTKRIDNLYDYYKSIYSMLGKIFVFNKTKIIPTDNSIDYKQWVNNYSQINSQINQLEERYKNARMKSEQLQIDDEIYDLKEKLDKLVKSLKGENNG